MAFILTQAHLDRIAEIAKKASDAAFSNVGILPTDSAGKKSDYYEHLQNGFTGVIRLCEAMADMPDSVQQWQDSLYKGRDKNLPDIPKESVQFMQNIQDEYELKGKLLEARTLWKDDPRSRGLDYQDTQLAIDDIGQKAAATEVLKYLETLQGWQRAATTPTPPRS